MKPTPNPTFSRRHAGYTIIELIVAIAITMLLLSMVGVIMTTTSEAVQTGAATSDVINNARSIGEQIAEDARHMIGPGGLTAESDPDTFDYNPGKGGFLIITRNDQTATILDPDLGEVSRSVRRDGLYFVRAGKGIKPLTPRDANTFASINAKPPYALVSYAHAQRDPDPDNLDNFADQWILARHVLCLYDNNAANVTNAVTNPAASQRVAGTKDIAYISLDDPESDAGQAENLLVGKNTTGQGKPLLGNNLSDGAYDTAALTLTFDSNRIQVNPNPDHAAITSDSFAQMHAVFAIHVSDFEVAYSVDNNNDGKLDRTGNSIDWQQLSNNGSIVFRHDDFDGSTSTWPHLIRIRYRVHDGTGQIAGQDGSGNKVSGRLFEKIIRVPRP